MNNPTTTTYTQLNNAYEFFNTRLFDSKLTPCLITVHKKRGAVGYFSGDKFHLGKQRTDEIALNPIHFEKRSEREILSTLAHEMAHLWQHHYGKPSRNGYHNREWATRMHAIGLQPKALTTVIDPDKIKETGQRVTHEIKKNGLFETVVTEFLQDNTINLYYEKENILAKKKAESKTKYTCGNCGANAWGSPTINIECGDCSEHMEQA